MLNIRVNRNKFLKSLKIVEKAVSENKIRPVISGVYLEATEGKIFLRGTNLELTISSFMFGRIFEEGAIVFSPQLVDEYLREIADEEITLFVNEGILIIETENSSSEFSLFDSEEFPKVKELTEGREYEVSKEMFVDLLEKAKIAAATSTENLAINTVRLEFEEGKMKLIATDTYRLIYMEEQLEDAIEGDTKVSIPFNTADALIKTLKSVGDDFIKVRYEGNQIMFIMEKETVQSRIIELAFPDYKGILGNMTYDKSVEIDTEGFISVLKRVSVFVKSNNEAKYSALFELQDGKFIIKGVSETAKIREEISLQQDGENLKISLNVKYLLDFLQYLDKQKPTEIKLLNSNSAVFLKGQGDEKFVYIAMPLALREEF
jgi:DNA polymerase-3 subunit beta